MCSRAAHHLRNAREIIQDEKTKAQARRRKADERRREWRGALQIFPIGSHRADVEVTDDFF